MREFKIASIPDNQVTTPPLFTNKEGVINLTSLLDKGADQAYYSLPKIVRLFISKETYRKRFIKRIEKSL